MEKSKFNAWLQKILATEEDEISCSECFDLVSDYVEAELSGAPISFALQKVKHHIHQCSICQDEYVLLRDLVRSDDDALESSSEGHSG